MVDWKYDILFSFNITHPGPAPDDFYLYPTSSCRGIFRKFGLLFKPSAGGGLVIQEKRVLPDGSLEVLRPVGGLTSFTFILANRNPAQLPLIKPFDGSLPEFSGRRRILYLDNLDNSFNIDASLSFPPQVTPIDTDLAAYELARTGTVSDVDLGSLTPNIFSLLEDPANTSQVTVSSRKPNPPADQNFPVSSSNRKVDLELGTGAFRLDKSGSVNSSETIYADQALFGNSTFGIIQIFKDAAVDYNTTIRYDLIFENA